MGDVVRLHHARAPCASKSARTRSIALPAAPRDGGPSVSQRCTVVWYTPKRAAKAAWLSPTRSRAARTISAVIMPSLCISHSTSQCLLHSEVGHPPGMQTAYERLQRARELAGYETATEAANALGVAPPTYMGHENGSRGFKGKAERYAAFFRVDYGWLMTGRGEPRSTSLEARVNALPPEERRRVFEYIEFAESRAGLRQTG